MCACPAAELSKQTRRAAKDAAKPVDFALLAKQLETLPDLASSECYEEISLWSQVAGLSHAIYARLEATLASYEGGDGDGESDGEGAGDGDGDRGASGAGPGQGYMEKVAGNFEEDLDKIRQGDGFDASQISVLIDSLEAGVDIFGST